MVALGLYGSRPGSDGVVGGGDGGGLVEFAKRPVRQISVTWKPFGSLLFLKLLPGI